MSVEREKSYMLAIPKDPQDLIDVEGIFERLAFAEDFIIKKHSMTEGTINIVLDYKGREYSADFYPYDFKLPEFYRTAHIFNDVDIEAIEKADAGIAVDMFFDENYMDSYHLQLKLIDTILPEKIAVFDDSAEKIMAGDWVKMAAQSMVAPAPKYLFTTQAVSDESGEIWLHTHGLNRCAVTELEILDSTRDTYKTHYNIIETMAKRLLDAEEAFDEKDPVFIARLSNGNDFVATFVNYADALKEYPENILGGAKDRTDGHNKNTSVVFTYPSKEYFDEGRFVPVSIYDEILEDNPIFMFSNAETARMKALAGERIGFAVDAAKNPENTVLLKIGLETDSDYSENDMPYEHIWFKLIKFEDDRSFTAELTQEPYYVKGIHTGDTGKYALEDITDWIIYTPERAVTPDDAYLLKR